MASQKPGRYLKTFLEPVASFSQSIGPYRPWRPHSSQILQLLQVPKFSEQYISRTQSLNTIFYIGLGLPGFFRTPLDLQPRPWYIETSKSFNYLLVLLGSYVDVRREFSQKARFEVWAFFAHILWKQYIYRKHYSANSLAILTILFYDFPDFYEIVKIPWRNSEPDAPKDGPRSLSQTPFVKEMVTKKHPLLGGTAATTAAEEFPNISHPHPITHRDGISRSGQPLTPMRNICVFIIILFVLGEIYAFLCEQTALFVKIHGHRGATYFHKERSLFT